MKKVLSICLLFWIYNSCISQQKSHQSVFLTNQEDKNYLTQNGFNPFVSRIKKIPPNRDRLEKKINDTLVSYIFQDDSLRHIDLTVLLRQNDSSTIFGLIKSVGFVRDLTTENQIVFYNKAFNIRYQAFIHPKDVLFVNTISKSLIPKMDSVVKKDPSK